MLVSIMAAILLVAAALLLARALPVQNICFILLSLMVFEMALDNIWIGHITLGQALFWPALIVLARTGCRGILCWRRRNWNYGIWLILMASTVTGVVQCDLAMPHLGAIALVFPFGPSLVRFASTALCLVVLSPWFISKLPQKPEEDAQ